MRFYLLRAYQQTDSFQDFEDWDDVGLNVPRPADLHTMYREFCSRMPGYVQRKDASCYANMNGENNSFIESGDANQSELLNKLVSTKPFLLSVSSVFLVSVEF